MKVLIVDDSVVYRTAIKGALMQSGESYEIDIAANGKIAIDKIKMDHFDIVTLDLEMPVMDGVETIKELRTFNKDLPVIIFSAQNMNAADKTLKALELGADDFVSKIEGSQDIQENLKMINEELIPRFNALTLKKGVTVKKAPISQVRDNQSSKVSLKNFKPNLICIASSTGGPDVLKKIFKDLKKLPVPILLVQHMPPVFTTQLAKSLDTISEMDVVEAQDGDDLKAGTVYLAPGDYHMKLVKKGQQSYCIGLNQDPKVSYVRPAADVTFDSVAEHYDGGVLTVVLTGMGNDGANGSAALKKRGAKVIIQDEDSSIVWGMPKAVYDLGVQDASLDPSSIVQIIHQMILG